MSKNRPNITVKPNIANDVIALLNAQQGWDAVPVGTALGKRLVGLNFYGDLNLHNCFSFL